MPIGPSYEFPLCGLRLRGSAAIDPNAPLLEIDKNVVRLYLQLRRSKTFSAMVCYPLKAVLLKADKARKKLPELGFGTLLGAIDPGKTDALSDRVPLYPARDRCAKQRLLSREVVSLLIYGDHPRSLGEDHLVVKHRGRRSRFLAFWAPLRIATLTRLELVFNWGMTTTPLRGWVIPKVTIFIAHGCALPRGKLPAREVRGAMSPCLCGGVFGSDGAGALVEHYLAAGHLLPAPHGHINIPRVEFHQARSPPGPLGGKQC